MTENRSTASIELARAGAEPVPGYRLVDVLGRGGFGEVWKAEAAGGFHVAMKFVPLAKEAGRVELRALDILRNLRHPHLLHTFGSWEIQGFLVIAMELADRTLLDRFQEACRAGETGIPGEELLEYFREAAKGIDYLNEARHQFSSSGELLAIQHRDIKPQNLLLVGGSVKVADFGLARLLEHALTGHTGNLTPAYAPPEFFNRQTSGQSDQYSLAITYCHLRGGRLPFTGNMAALVSGHLRFAPDLSMVPERERPTVARALAKEPGQRWPTCRRFVEELRLNLSADSPAPPSAFKSTKMWSAEHDTPAGNERVATSVEGPNPTVSRQTSLTSIRRPRRRRTLVAGALVLTATGLCVAYAVRPRPGPTPPVDPPLPAPTISLPAAEPIPVQRARPIKPACRPASVAPRSQDANTPSMEPSDPLKAAESLTISKSSPLPAPAVLPSFILEAPPPFSIRAGRSVVIEKKPTLRLQVPNGAVVEAGKTVSFPVEVFREELPGPLKIRFDGLPADVLINELTSADSPTITAAIVAGPEALESERDITVVASGAGIEARTHLHLKIKRPARLEVAAPNSLAVEAGRSAKLHVQLRRSGGDLVQLRFEGAPEGVVLAGSGVIPAGASEAVLEVSAAASASDCRHDIRLVAVSGALKTEVAVRLTVKHRPQPRLDLPATLFVSPLLKRITSMQVRLVRDGLDGPVAVRFLGLPRSVSMSPVTIAADADSAVVDVLVEPDTQGEECHVYAVQAVGVAEHVQVEAHFKLLLSGPKTGP